MMRRRIAVEDDLTNVNRELEGSDYEVINLDEANLEEVDAIILSGEDENVMNMSDIKTETQIINARGLSAREVKETLEERLV